MQDFNAANELQQYPAHFTFNLLTEAVQLAYAVAAGHPQAIELAKHIKAKAEEAVKERDRLQPVIEEATMRLDEGDWDTDDQPMVSAGQDDGFYAYVCMWVPHAPAETEDSSTEDATA